MTIHPQHDRILIKRDEAETTSRGGIILPDQTQEKPQRGVIVAVGPGKRLPCAVSPRGYVLVPIEFAVGDRVIFTKYAGEGIKISGEEVFLVRDEDVTAVIELDGEPVNPNRTAVVPGLTPDERDADQLRKSMLANRFKSPSGVH